jgi:hypothetical protein
MDTPHVLEYFPQEWLQSGGLGPYFEEQVGSVIAAVESDTIGHSKGLDRVFHHACAGRGSHGEERHLREQLFDNACESNDAT